MILKKRISQLWKNKHIIEHDDSNFVINLDTSENDFIEESFQSDDSFCELKFTLITQGDSIQLSGIRFYSIDNKQIIPKTIINPRGSSSWDTTISNLIDNDLLIYWCDENYCSNGKSYIQCIFYKNEYIKYYELFSSPSKPEADPINWKVEGKNTNNSDWVLLDRRKKYPPPTDRMKSYGILPFNYGIENLRQSISSVIDDTGFVQPDTIRLYSSGEVASIWTEDRGQICEEYIPLIKKIAIRNEYMSDTILQQSLTYIDKLILYKPLKTSFKSLLVSILKKIFDIEASEVIFYKSNEDSPIYYNCIIDLYQGFSWRQSYLHAALRTLHYSNSTFIFDAINHLALVDSKCKSKQIEIFNYIINQSVKESKIEEKKKNIKDSIALEDKEDEDSNPHKVLENVFFEFLDDFKLKAFRSAFIEPTKFYYHQIRMDNIDEKIEIQASNVYSALLLSTLGIQIPIMPYFLEHISYCPPFLRAKEISTSCKPMNSSKYFGKPWTKISSCVDTVITDLPILPNNILEKENTTAVEIANNAINKSPELSLFRQEIAKYINRFVRFFSKRFIFEKLYLVLIQSNKKEMEIIFNELKDKKNIKEKSMDKWIYSSRTSKTHFNQNRASILYKHLKFIK